MMHLRKASLVLAFFLLGACAYTPPAGSRFGDFDSAPELTATPFYPQERYQCGPAALMTVLSHSGVNTTVEQLVRQVYLPAREGSLQAEMLATTRAVGRIPYRISGNLASLGAELRAGRPVLVLQNLGVRWWPRWHYAVAIGLNAEQAQLVLRSGTEERRVTPLRTFLHTWKRSGNWGIVILKPDEMPVDVDRERWFSALAGLEQTGPVDASVIAWQHAAERWPGSLVARFGMANSRYASGDWSGAEVVYRELLAEQPGLALARNNLALALLRQGHVEEALQEVSRARDAVANGTELQAEIDRTIQEIRAAQSRSGNPSSTSR